MKHSISLMTLLLLFLFISPATILATDELSEEQQHLQAEIEGSLVAPCCWNMTVDQHESPKSREVRAKITELIMAGKTKTEILDYFSSQPQYGERILATPSQKNLLGKMAYWLIPVAMLLGAFVVFKTIRSLSPGKDGDSEPEPVKTDSAGSKSADWDERVEQELKELDR